VGGGYRKSGSELPHSKLALVGGGGLAGGFGFGFSEEAVVAELPEDVEKENSRDAEHDQAFEEAVDGGDRSGVDDPADPRKRDEAEQDGKQQHHWKQSPSSEETILRFANHL
jgi:hypothetical protein